MADKIQLTPAELRAQAAEMSRLSDDYTRLFNQVTSELGRVNAGWSANLAHNFAGKITSAQSTFTQVVGMLQDGAKVADTCAVTFESVDTALAKLYSGEATDLPPGAAAAQLLPREPLAADLRNVSASWWDSLKEDAEDAGDTMAWLEEWYGEDMPDEFKIFIEGLCPNELEAAIKFTSDLLQGDVTKETIYDLVDEVANENVTVNVVVETIKYYIDKGEAMDAEMMADIESQLQDGDIIGAGFDMVEGFVDIIGGGVIDVGFAVAGDFVDNAIDKIPFMSDIVEYAFGDSVGSYIAGAGDWIAEGVDTVTDVISDGVNVVTDAVTDGVKAVGNWIGGWFD